MLLTSEGDTLKLMCSCFFSSWTHCGGGATALKRCVFMCQEWLMLCVWVCVFFQAPPSNMLHYCTARLRLSSTFHALLAFFSPPSSLPPHHSFQMVTLRVGLSHSPSLLCTSSYPPKRQCCAGALPSPLSTSISETSTLTLSSHLLLYFSFFPELQQMA